MNGSDLRVRDDVEQRFPNSTKQESTMAFFPLDSSLWDSGDNTSTLSPHQTFSSTIWDIPGLELDSAVNMMPTLSYESSFDDPQTSSNATYQLEADWSDSPPPTTRSRLQSEECEENMRKEKRREQNRRAQQAYRMRKDHQITAMEKELNQLREAFRQLKNEHQTLLGQLTAVKIAVA